MPLHLDVQRELQDPKSTKWNLLSQGQRADLSLEAQRSQAKVAASTFDIVKDAIDQGRFDMSTGKLEGAGAKQMTGGKGSGENGADLTELMDRFAPGKPGADRPNQGLKSAPF